MRRLNRGRLFGVSVGPGDPDLMTIQAVRTIESCQVIAVPRTGGGKTMALDIAARTVDTAGKDILYLDFLMTSDREKLKENHVRLTKLVCDYLDEGKDVALLNMGDASLYSTWSYINELAKLSGYDTETIPGVTSFCAVAATLNTSLTTMRAPLHIIPASFTDMETALSLEGTKVIMKSGCALSDVKKALGECGLSDRASLVANCGLENQRVYANVEDSTDDEGYFVTVLVSL